MVFMGEEYGCSGRDLGKKTRETFTELADYLSLVFNLFSLPGGNKGETDKLKSSTASSDQCDPWQNYL